jgi:catechol 2,3-dioxygenase-like lactoylglutathione lyase family enzyme
VSRVQLALNVADLDQAVSFYTKLFGVEPAKLRPGYANFAIAEPPLKLVLIEGAGVPGSLNHLGVEVETTEQVADTQRRLAAEGLATAVEDEVSCCYAVQRVKRAPRHVARSAPIWPARQPPLRPPAAEPGATSS